MNLVKTMVAAIAVVAGASLKAVVEQANVNLLFWLEALIQQRLRYVIITLIVISGGLVGCGSDAQGIIPESQVAITATIEPTTTTEPLVAPTAVQPTPSPASTTTVEEEPQVPDTSEPTPVPTAVTEVIADVSVSGGAQLALPDGPSINIPPGALYEDSQVTLKRAEVLPEANAGTYEVIDDAFEFDLAAGDVFAAPVTVSIPYYESMLPDGVPEANLFAVFLHEGEWVRVPTDVDEDSNLLTVATLHNGLWAWAMDTITNIDIGVREFLRRYLGIVESEEILDEATAIQEAQAEVDRRYLEYLTAWNRCDVIAEELEHDINPLNLVADLWPEVQEHIVLEGTTLIAESLGGKAAVLTIGGHTVGIWVGAATVGASGGIYLGQVAGDSILGVRCLLRWESAYRRLQEARAVLEQLEHPDRTSAFPEDAIILTEWVELQTDVQPDDEFPIVDWRKTNHANSPENIIVPDFYARYTCIEGEGNSLVSSDDDPRHRPGDSEDICSNIANTGGGEFLYEYKLQNRGGGGSVEFLFIRSDGTSRTFFITDGKPKSGDFWLPPEGVVIKRDAGSFEWADSIKTTSWPSSEFTPIRTDVISISGEKVEVLVYEEEREVLTRDNLNQERSFTTLSRTIAYYDLSSGLLLRSEHTNPIIDCTVCDESLIGFNFPMSLTYELVETNQPLATQ